MLVLQDVNQFYGETPPKKTKNRAGLCGPSYLENIGLNKVSGRFPWCRAFQNLLAGYTPERERERAILEVLT